jgi:LEA14-like dessication related protein
MTNKLNTLILILTLFLTACAQRQSDFKQPVVALNSIKMVSSNKLAPEFELDLHVINPNNIDLKLKGLSYSIQINDKNIITGVSNKLPLIKAYGEGDISLQAKANLLSSLELIRGLFEQTNKELNYKVDVDIDIGGFYPNINITRKGKLSELLNH